MSLIDDPVIFVVPGDLHLTEAGLDNHLAAIRLIDEVNDVIRPDFVQFIGDNVQDATDGQFHLLEGIWKFRRIAKFQPPLSAKLGNIVASVPDAGA